MEDGGDEEAQLRFTDEGHQHAIVSRSHCISGRNGSHLVSLLNNEQSCSLARELISKSTLAMVVMILTGTGSRASSDSIFQQLQIHKTLHCRRC